MTARARGILRGLMGRFVNNASRRCCTAALLALVLVLLTACGQKGDLYRSETETADRDIPAQGGTA